MFSACCCSNKGEADAEVIGNPSVSQRDRDLCSACQRGAVEEVTTLLLRGAAVNARAREGSAPLAHAAMSGHAAVIQRLLLEVELDVNMGSLVPVNTNQHLRTALHWAIGNGHTKIVEYLLADSRTNVEAVSHVGFTPLMLAADEGDVNATEILLAKKADVTYTIVDNDITLSPVRVAIAENHARVLRLLLKEGRVDINRPYPDVCGPSTTFLDLAVTFNLPQAGLVLLEHKADPNQKSSDGKNPIERAVEQDLGEFINLMCLYGADLSGSFSELKRAQISGDAQEVLKLLNGGHRISDWCQDFHAAAIRGDVGNTEALINSCHRAAKCMGTDDVQFLPAAYFAAELNNLEVLVKLLDDAHAFGRDKAEEVVRNANIAGKSTFVNENGFKLVRSLLDPKMKLISDEKTAEGAFGIVKPWCGALATLRYFSEKPEDFVALRDLCRDYNEAIYSKIDQEVGPSTLKVLSNMAPTASSDSLRQDDNGLLPAFKYLTDGDNGCMHAAGNLEVYAGRTLALLGRGLNKTFGLDMKTIGGQGIEVQVAPAKTFVRMFNKLQNPAEHGDPTLAKPRPMKNVDIIRALAIVEKADDMQKAYDALAAKYKVLRVKNSHDLSHGYVGYRSLLVNFAYRTGVTFKQVFGDTGRFDKSINAMHPTANDEIGKMWCDYAKTLGQSEAWLWSLMPLWRIARLEPQREIVLSAEVQFVYSPYMAGRSLSHLLYKISRCNTGADEMNRDFGHGGIKQWSQEDKVKREAVEQIASRSRP